MPYLIKLLLFCAFASSLSGAQQPNVILINVDDQGYGDLGCTGNPIIQTPHIDQLYNESVRFTDYHVNAVCAPSRAALMAGQNAAKVGVWHTLGGNEIVRADVTLMPEYFKRGGYSTMMVGKWHIGDNFPFRPEDRGFDQVYRIGGGNPGQVPDYWGNGIFDTHYWDGKQWLGSQGFCTDVQFDRSMDFIRQHKEEPFFLYLATTAVHSPVGAPEEYYALYPQLEGKVQAFYAMVSNLDTNVGRLREFLKAERLSENTTGRYLKMVKTFALKAKAQGIEVHPFVDEFKGFTVKSPHVTLTFPELDRIRALRFEDKRLESAKDWLLIGCFTGQRVSDLLRMNRTMLVEVKSKGGNTIELIALTQEKTKAKVQIPVHKIVKDILDKREGDFPPTFGRTKESAGVLFNRYIKKVCKEARIDEPTLGVKFNPLTKRNESGYFPKWELTSSHICRRSFATNHYGQRLYPLPLLMNVTGHKSEKSFLTYIDRTRDDLSLELAEIWSNLTLDEVSPSKMRLVKLA